MDRKEFTQKLVALGLCPMILPDIMYGQTADDNIEKIKSDKEFVEHWLSDLIDSMYENLDRETMVKAVEGCGKACFNRYSFKQQVAERGKGDVMKLLESYTKNFEAWIDGDKFHIRYGETSPGCYCPAAKYRTPKPNDVHCECTRMTHQTIFKTALGKDYKIDILETVRRGGKTCHFVVNLT